MSAFVARLSQHPVSFRSRSSIQWVDFCADDKMAQEGSDFSNSDVNEYCDACMEDLMSPIADAADMLGP